MGATCGWLLVQRWVKGALPLLLLLLLSLRHVMLLVLQLPSFTLPPQTYVSGMDLQRSQSCSYGMMWVSCK